MDSDETETAIWDVFPLSMLWDVHKIVSWSLVSLFPLYIRKSKGFFKAGQMKLSVFIQRHFVYFDIYVCLGFHSQVWPISRWPKKSRRAIDLQSGPCAQTREARLIALRIQHVRWTGTISTSDWLQPFETLSETVRQHVRHNSYDWETTARAIQHRSRTIYKL